MYIFISTDVKKHQKRTIILIISLFFIIITIEIKEDVKEGDGSFTEEEEGLIEDINDGDGGEEIDDVETNEIIEGNREDKDLENDIEEDIDTIGISVNNSRLYSE